MNLNALFPTLISAFAVAVVLSWIKRKINDYDPVGLSSVVGTIKPHKGIIWFVLSSGTVFFLLGALAAIFISGMLVYGSACAFMGGFFVIAVIPSLTSIHDVNWTQDSLNGPRAVKFQMMGLSRSDLNWSEIVTVGLVKGGYYFVENNEGDRVYWSRVYKGFEDFEATVAEKCPTLTLPKYELHQNANNS
ncbi:MAG: hypothetical protein ACSHXY_07795 [Alphaproteobacteria bacterium]